MAIYLIMIYTLTLLNSQSQQKVANTLPLLHLLLPKTHSLLQNLLKNTGQVAQTGSKRWHVPIRSCCIFVS